MPKPLSKSASPFERKIKDIEREKKRVQDEIKALSRALKKGDVPPAPTAARTRPSPPVTRAESTPIAPSSVGAGTSGAAGAAERDLFAWQQDPESSRAPSTASPYARDRQPPVRGDERFANYFATGGFKSPLPSRKPKSVQRNKAVFIGVVAVIVVYIIIHSVVR